MFVNTLYSLLKPDDYRCSSNTSSSNVSEDVYGDIQRYRQNSVEFGIPKTWINFKIKIYLLTH